MSKRLNARLDAEEQLMDAIHTWLRIHNYGPAFRDLAEVTGRSLGSVHALCRSLREQNKITFTDNISRSIRLI